MLAELFRSNAVDGRWAEAMIAGCRRSRSWNAPRSGPLTPAGASLGYNGRPVAEEARHMARI